MIRDMKKIILSVLLISITTGFLFAQDEPHEKEKGFKKENLFTGGTVTVSFYSGGTILGGNPFFGYKLTDWIDAGIVANYTYAGSRDNVYINDKVRQNIYGGGVFTRIYPARFFFLQAQAEHNFTRTKYIYPNGGATEHYKTDANSLLLGVGLAQGRQPGSNTFYYISLLFDVIKNPSSPYVNNVYDPNTHVLVRTDFLPILRAGINIGLFEGRHRR
jgi:hypothetical protein